MAAARFPVEASHVMMFARAVGDPNPIYYDADYAAKVTFGNRIAHGLLLSSVGVGMIPPRLKRALGPMRTNAAWRSFATRPLPRA